MQAMRQPLPGKVAHDVLMSYHRPSVEEARSSQPPAKESAVMMLLFERQSIWHTLVIERTASPGVHGGQLAFPGGKLENHETHLEAAMRETYEEIGVASDQLELLGPLSELYIPPSHFVVAPFVALLKTDTIGPLNASEVHRAFEVPLAHFQSERCIDHYQVNLSGQGKTLQVPGFAIEGHVIWGATAMMIQEFRHLMGFV